MKIEDVKPGTIIFGPIGGAVGLGVGLGQLSLAAIEPGPIRSMGVKKWWRLRHVLVALGQGRAVQAMPSGAEEIALTEKHWTKDYVYVLPDYPEGSPFEIGYRHRSGGFKVAHAARGYVGRGYNFATYAAIPAHRLHVPVPHLDRYISSSKRMICSQLADQAMCDAGWHNFDDGRLPQDVTPFELFRALVAQPGVQVYSPDPNW